MIAYCVFGSERLRCYPRESLAQAFGAALSFTLHAPACVTTSPPTAHGKLSHVSDGEPLLASSRPGVHLRHGSPVPPQPLVFLERRSRQRLSRRERRRRFLLLVCLALSEAGVHGHFGSAR